MCWYLEISKKARFVAYQRVFLSKAAVGSEYGKGKGKGKDKDAGKVRARLVLNKGSCIDMLENMSKW